MLPAFRDEADKYPSAQPLQPALMHLPMSTALIVPHHISFINTGENIIIVLLFLSLSVVPNILLGQRQRHHATWSPWPSRGFTV